MRSLCGLSPSVSPLNAAPRKITTKAAVVGVHDGLVVARTTWHPRGGRLWAPSLSALESRLLRLSWATSLGLGVGCQEIVHSEPLCEGGCRQTTSPNRKGPRMDIHKNARTTLSSRAEIVKRVQARERVAEVARAFSVCDRTVNK